MDVAILDSGATHRLWHSHKVFISYKKVYNQYVTLADNTRIPISGKGVIAIKMGSKKVIIRDVYHVPALRLLLFSLRFYRGIPSCGYHSNNEGAVIFFPLFSLAVNDEVDNYVTCCSIGRSAKTFNYIQPRASAKSAAARLAPRRSARINPSSSKNSLVWTPVQSQPVGPAKGSAFTPLPSKPAPRRSTRLNPKIVRFASPPSPDAGGAAPTTTEPRLSPRLIPPTSAAPSDDLSVPLESVYKPTESESSDNEPKPSIPLRGRPKLQTARINHAAFLLFCRNSATPPPDIRCCDTPNGSDSLQDLTSEKIYHLFGNRRFRNYEHFEHVSKDAKFVEGGEPYPSLGEFANLRKRNHGKALPPSKRYLDKVHLDIVYGDSISRLGFRFALLLIDHATCVRPDFFEGVDHAVGL